MQVNSKSSNQQKKGQNSLRVVNPIAILSFKPLSPAKRLKELKNKKIGLYWNLKARGNIALDRVKELLSERFEGMTFEWFQHPASEEAPIEWFENIKKSGVDGVVASTGD
jgi:dipeptidase